jgi:hypothetical protein
MRRKPGDRHTAKKQTPLDKKIFVISLAGQMVELFTDYEKTQEREKVFDANSASLFAGEFIRRAVIEVLKDQPLRGDSNTIDLYDKMKTDLEHNIALAFNQALSTCSGIDVRYICAINPALEKDPKKDS